MIAGRSPWLCQGTMPPGSIVSLRKRSWRSLMFAGSLSRSMAASTVSVTPLPAWLDGVRTSALNLPAGHSPAADADTPASVAPAVTAARTTPRPLAIRLNMFVISFVTLRREGAVAVRSIHRTDGERKCRLALDSIADCYGKKAPALLMERVSNYFAVTLEVIEAMTVDAILNWSLRFLIPCRRAIQSKSVYAVQTSPLSLSNTRSRTGQSRPALALALMNCVPSGGLPKIRSTDG